MSSENKKNVVIVGAGIFGMSTALWMLEEGGYQITILDKSDTLPAPDAASTDLNKIIRAGDYADLHLAKLCIDAVELWRKPEWEGTYHESGVVCLSSVNDSKGHDFVKRAYQNCKTLNLGATLTPDSPSLKRFFPADVETGAFGGREGYHNPIGGWAEAGRAVEVGLKMVKEKGGVVRSGCEVVDLKRIGKEVKAVVLKSGEVVDADLVVVAAGAWTPSLFASESINIRLPPIEATGQSVGMIQLTPEEVKRYSAIPVVFCLDNGYYVFPPNPQGIIKMAIHAAGYTYRATSTTGTSTPRTKLTPGAESGAIPKEMLASLRKGLTQVYPELSKKDFIDTRMCWYCDTVTGDWLIDYHPDFDNLVIATGGSGHAFKFAPIIGREILDIIKRQPTELGRRLAFIPSEEAGADVRLGVRQELVLSDLVTPEDLKAPVVGTAA